MIPLIKQIKVKICVNKTMAKSKDRVCDYCGEPLDVFNGRLECNNCMSINYW